jgi:hypothetical protein
MTKTKQDNAFGLLEPIIISFFWILLFASPLLFGRFDNGIEWTHVFNVWRRYLPLLFLFFINRFVFLSKLFFRNKRLLFFICVGSLITLLTMGTYFFRADNSPRIENMPPREAAFNSPHPIHPPPPGRRDIIKPPAHPRPEPIPPFVSLIILSILIVGFDTGLKVSMKWAQSEREKINLEKENVENQLAFLRNQVSPHFFMNTLQRQLYTRN